MQAPAAGPNIQLRPEHEAALLQFAAQNEVNPVFMPVLRRLVAYDVVVICDDSGSMQAPADPNIPYVSRWQELQQNMQLLLNCTQCFGMVVDVYFLNRGVFRNIANYGQLLPGFAAPPAGGTNIVRTMQQVWADRRIGPDLGRPLIVHLFTDGHPTNDAWQEDMAGLEYWLRNRSAIRQTYFSIALCTDEDEIGDMYRPIEFRQKGVNGWTGSECGVPGVDVSEDYRGEVQDVKRFRGPNCRFTMGDYVVKFLLGAIEPTVHSFDLPAGTNIYGDGTSGSGSDGGCCCVAS